MTVVHIVLFKFRADVSSEHKQAFVSEIKTLRTLPCVKSQRLVIGGPSVSKPIEGSKGFEFALVSYHEDQKALAEYQVNSEHVRVVTDYVLPYREDLIRFDFEVDGDDEDSLGFLPALGGAKA